MLKAGKNPKFIQQGMMLLRPEDKLPWRVEDIFEDGRITKVRLLRRNIALIVPSKVARTFILAKDFDPDREPEW